MELGSYMSSIGMNGRMKERHCLLKVEGNIFVSVMFSGFHTRLEVVK